MRPKFEVGEVVILQSVEYPEFNGEYEIEGLVTGQVGDRFLYNGIFYRFARGLVYFLKGDLKHPTGDWQLSWAESALRKKHIPGELSFTDLMASLSSPKLITHDH